VRYVIGLGSEKGIEKFVVWQVEVIFTGIKRDGVESFCNLRRPRSHFLSGCNETTECRNDKGVPGF